MEIKLKKEEKIKVMNSKDLFSIMQQILLREDKIDRNREHFWIVALENNNRILLIELIAMGTVNQVPVHPMEVFSFALQKRAVRIILVHNHPTGEMKASEDDKDITDRLIQVGIIVKTPVLDHLIISPKKYLSFKDEGLMDELAKSLKYVPPYKREERIKELAKQTGREGARKEMLIKLKREGVDIETMMKVTGLSKQEIKKLR